MSSPNNPLFAPNDRTLRQFSAIWIVAFAALAARQEFHHHRHVLAVVLGIMAVTIGPAGLIWPRAVRPIFVGWMRLVHPIGWVVSRVILSLIFYGLFTPVAWFFRWTGRDALGLKAQPQAGSFWKSKPKVLDKAQYLRQF